MATPINKVNRAELVGIAKTLKTKAEQLMVGDIPVPKTSAEVPSSITSPDDLTGDVDEQQKNIARLKIRDKSCVVETEFEVDLDHQKTGPEIFRNTRLALTASIVLGGVVEESVKTTEQLRAHLKAIVDKNEMITVFLCGGPGASNPPDRNPEFNDTYLKNGGCIIFLDYRGTGKSILEIRDKTQPKLMEEWNKRYVPLLRPPYDRNDPDMAMNEERDKQMAGFLTLFRHDNIVRDLEAIRLCLFGASKKWNIFGQSYGGWISLSYLSLFPEALESSRITAGLAPITSDPEETYLNLFKVLREHNDEYYSRYPEDIGRVKQIVKYLLSIRPESSIALANGGRLTARRFLCLGRNLGAWDRWAPMHELIKRMCTDITGNKGLSKKAIEMYEAEDSWKFDNRPLYAVLHEAMYCSGKASQWIAQEVARDLKISNSKQFEWAGAETESESNAILAKLCASDDNVRIHFSGEMVYPFMFKDYGYLRPLAGVAQELAKHEWNKPYNMAQLNKNQVPVYAISYKSDMHVNEELSQNTAAWVKGIEHVVLDYIPKPKSKEEEELKRMIRDRKEVDKLRLENDDGRFQHASVRSHANIVLSCMEELVKRSKA
ncbi:hypothetical protein LQW54_009976 [Pestalotiopsis sp. IQ-011]